MEALEVLRFFLGLALVLFIPGFALTLALWPKTKKEDTIDSIERIALSFGLSIAIVPLIGIILDKTPYGIRLKSIVVSLILVTTLFFGICFYRRRKWNASKSLP